MSRISSGGADETKPESLPQTVVELQEVGASGGVMNPEHMMNDNTNVTTLAQYDDVIFGAPGEIKTVNSVFISAQGVGGSADITISNQYIENKSASLTITDTSSFQEETLMLVGPLDEIKFFCDSGEVDIRYAKMNVEPLPQHRHEI